MCNNTEKVYGFYSGKKDLSTQPRRLSEKGIKCDFVVLSLWNSENDNQDTLKSVGTIPGVAFGDTSDEIWWGFEGEPVHQLLPTQSTHFLIPVKDARDIWVRRNRRKGVAVMVAFSCFRKVVEGEE